MPVCGGESILVGYFSPGQYPTIWYPSWPNALGLITLLLRVPVAFSFQVSGVLLLLCHLRILISEIKDQLRGFRAVARD